MNCVSDGSLRTDLRGESARANLPHLVCFAAGCATWTVGLTISEIAKNLFQNFRTAPGELAPRLSSLDAISNVCSPP